MSSRYILVRGKYSIMIMITDLESKRFGHEFISFHLQAMWIFFSFKSYLLELMYNHTEY